MNKKKITAMLLVLFPAPCVLAQDADTILENVAEAMGADNLDSIRYSGTGWNAGVGQSYDPTEDWPRFDITAYTRTIDYDGRSSYEDLTRVQGDNPQRGGGGTPLIGEQRAVSVVSGDYAWNVNGQNIAPQPAQAELRQLDIWLSPHGVIKAAMEADDLSATVLMLEGREMTILSFTWDDKYKVNAHITPDNLVERTQTWVANPVFGDMVYEYRFTDYQNHDGVMFPGVIHAHQGDPSIFPGHNWMEVRASSVTPNADAPELEVTAAVRGATVPAVNIATTEVAPGVWWIAGGSHHSVLVEFSDFVTVIEGPQNEARSIAVINEVQRLVPGKPLRFVVNTHHHFDHSGGLRTFVAQGATVVTHERNEDFYRNVFFHPAPRTLEPDRLSGLLPWFAGNRDRSIQTLDAKYTISDGTRTMDLYPVQGLNHNSNMLIAHLPTERILVNADLFSPAAPGAPALVVNQSMLALRDNIERLGLAVEEHLPLHGVPGTHEEFISLVGAAGN